MEAERVDEGISMMAVDGAVESTQIRDTEVDLAISSLIDTVYSAPPIDQSEICDSLSAQVSITLSLCYNSSLFAR